MNDDVPAVVLAAGEGRRLAPLTNRRPKPMVPVANKPLLEHVVTAIADAGVDRIVLVVGYHRERIRNHFADGDDWGVDIEYAVQSNQLGTAHAILQAESVVDGRFLVLNGDRIVDPSLVERVREATLERDPPVVSVTPSDRPGDYGVVTLDGERAVSIEEKPRDPVATGVINAGVYGFDTRIFDAIETTSSDGGELAITTTLNRLAADGGLHAVRYRGTWLDVSYLWDLLSVNAAMVDDRRGEGDDRSDAAGDAPAADPTASVADDVVVGRDVQVDANAAVGGGTAVGDNVTVEAGAVVSNAVVLQDAVVEAGAVVRDAVIAENARVGANATVAGGESTVLVDGEVHEGVDFGGVVGDNATLGSGATVEPGTVIGDGATVDHGVAVGGRIDPDAVVRRG